MYSYNSIVSKCIKQKLSELKEIDKLMIIMEDINIVLSVNARTVDKINIDVVLSNNMIKYPDLIDTCNTVSHDFRIYIF